LALLLGIFIRECPNIVFEPGQKRVLVGSAGVTRANVENVMESGKFLL